RRAPDKTRNGGGAHGDDELRLDQVAFEIEPEAAGADLAGIGLLVDAALAPRLEFEMLDGIGDVSGAAIDPGGLQRLVEHLPGRPDKGFSGKVFLVAGLLADEHHGRLARTFAEDGLGRVFIERAAGTGGGRLARRR